MLTRVSAVNNNNNNLLSDIKQYESTTPAPTPAPRTQWPRSQLQPNEPVSRPQSAPQAPLPTIHGHQRPHSEAPQNHSERENDPIGTRIVAEGEVDPTHLVPAQTNAGDSLSPPSTAVMNTDHVPFIPAPPLLTTHRVLQARLDELEDRLKEYRTLKVRAAQGEDVNGMSEDDMNQIILQYTALAAEVKQTLNRVRTLYMSAATIPTVLQFQAHLIAYQITLIESSIFRAIPPQALLEHSAKHPHPRIVASTDFFNYITRVIEHGILLPQEAATRAQHMNHWIKVASKCLDLNNYQTLKAIVSALGTPPVQRLRRTWAYIPKKSLTKLETLSELMSEANNYGKYREHMGMVSSSVINGKSVVTIRAEHYTRPTVPFLGTFIHDMTYLVAAAKSSGHQPAEDPRVREVLQCMERFQNGPRYSPVPPATFLKASQKHHIRPAISSALHRSASGIGRFSGGMFFSNDDESVKESMDDEDNLEEQQQMITQYILMRSWVNQNTVDELSMLREPPRQTKSTYNQHRSTSGSNYHTSSIVSNSSSMMRFSTGSVSMSTLSSNTGGGSDSRPASTEESRSSEDTDSPKTSGLWPFRRSMDSHRPSLELTMTTVTCDGSDVDTAAAVGDQPIKTRSAAAAAAAAPHIPPRPPNRPARQQQQQQQQSNQQQSNEQEFKSALAQKIQEQVAARHS